MIWANKLGTLEYYLIGAFIVSYLLYQTRLLRITTKKNEISPGNILKKLILRCIYFSLIVIAALGPSFGDIKKELKSEGKDIFLLLDVSSSMNAYDIPPSRLEKAKKELKYLLKNLRYNDRVGLILFAEDASLQCPLTFDLEAVKLYLETANTERIVSQGTNLENALDFTFKRHMLSNKQDKIPTTKIVVLVTDGESLEDKAYDIAVRMKQNNIFLYIMGVGTEKGSKIPIHPGFKKDLKGKYVVTRLHKEILTRLASINGEDFYAIGKNYTQTSACIDKLNSLQGTVKQVKKIDLSSNKYYYFLAMALFFIIIDGLTTVNIIKI
jgi:Ca-activated chloride channel family protein